MPKTSYDVPAVRKAINLLNVLSNSHRPLGVSEICRELGLNKNMTFRLLATLQEEGWISAEEPGPKYSLTLAPFEIASRVVNRLTLKEACAGPARELWEDVGVSTYVGQLHGDKVLYIEHFDSTQYVRLSGSIGGAYPLHCSAPGKVLLAYMNASKRKKLFSSYKFASYTDKTITDPERMESHLEIIRQRGYAIDDEEFGRGLICFAVPIFGIDNAVAGTIGVSVTTITHDMNSLLQELGPRVTLAGEEISKRLGYKEKSEPIAAKAPLPERLSRLVARVEEEFHNSPGRTILISREEQEFYAKLALKVFTANAGAPQPERMAEFLEKFAKKSPIEIDDDQLILGSQKFSRIPWNDLSTPEKLEKAKIHGNGGHFIAGYGFLLEKGVNNLLKAVKNIQADEKSSQNSNKTAFERTLKAFSTYIRRHGEAAELAASGASDNRNHQAYRGISKERKLELASIAEVCRNIAEKPAKTFHEGLQLVWMAQIFLHAEGMAEAISFGRLDQYLWPLLKDDLEHERLTKREAEELLGCFWIKCCEGDVSQNLIVGGVDENGDNAENPLSMMCLKVAGQLKVWQPSLSVRIGPKSSDEFWHQSLALCAQGIGMPSFFNDPVVINSLKAVGTATKDARDWGIVGCYEAAPNIDAYPLTVMGQAPLAPILLDFLDTEPDCADFAEFYEAFKQFTAARLQERHKRFEEAWLNGQTNGSPFFSSLSPSCLASGLTAQEGGCKYNFYGVNILGLGTVVDSLFVIKQLIYKEKKIGLIELIEAMKANFPDENLRQVCKNVKGKYGSDSAESNELAENYSTFVSHFFISRPFSNGVRPYPAFFQFTGDIHNQTPATPDGRRNAERLSYGCGPSDEVNGTDITSVLKSAASLPHDQCACGNPLMLSFSKNDIQGTPGLLRLRKVIETYFGMGGFHLQMNVTDVDMLRKAQKGDPSLRELTVRISGFSARFSALEKGLQDAIIERAALQNG